MHLVTDFVCKYNLRVINFHLPWLAFSRSLKIINYRFDDQEQERRREEERLTHKTSFYQPIPGEKLKLGGTKTGS
jgi:hypothetical protein